MNRFTVAALVILLPALSHAADPAAPVTEIMQATVSNWADDGSEPEDLFSEDRLARLYSTDFVTRYRAAARFPAFDGGTSPFDWDVIVNGQDGCPLKDLSVAAGAAKAGVTEVVARFQQIYCFGTEPEYQKYTEVHFDIVEEDGRPVVDDIKAQTVDGDYESLKGIMDGISNQ